MFCGDYEDHLFQGWLPLLNAISKLFQPLHALSTMFYYLKKTNIMAEEEKKTDNNNKCCFT